MRVLLDENLPHDLMASLVGHEVMTVQRLGWAGTLNGELLKRITGVADAFVTMDRKLERQHDLTTLAFGVVLNRGSVKQNAGLAPAGRCPSGGLGSHQAMRGRASWRAAPSLEIAASDKIRD